jgi:DedD protein
MAFFKFRKGDDDRMAAAAQPESVEVLRKRARHRLIGAAVLVLVAVIGFPILFDTQPRPIAVDIPIEIPDRGATKPLALPTPSAATAPSSSPSVTGPATPSAAAAAPVAAPPAAAPAVAQAPAEPARPAASAAQGGKVATAASLDAREQVVSDKAPKAEPKPAAKADAAKPEVVKPAAAAPATAAAPAKADDGARAKALLEGKPVEVAAAKPAEVAAAKPAAAEGRFVVQFGAFSENAKAQEARQKVERAGLKTYVHVAETKDGKRIRVRVGPFANRADAEKAASKIKGLDLPANILTL